MRGGSAQRIGQHKIGSDDGTRQRRRQQSFHVRRFRKLFVHPSNPVGGVICGNRKGRVGFGATQQRSATLSLARPLNDTVIAEESERTKAKQGTTPREGQILFLKINVSIQRLLRFSTSTHLSASVVSCSSLVARRVSARWRSWSMLRRARRSAKMFMRCWSSRPWARNVLITLA